MFLKNNITEDYNCSDYLARYKDGFYHEASYLQLVLPVSDSKINEKFEHLTIGYAGADGIEFCFRKNKVGIWAFYPIDETYESKAESIADLISGWSSGSIFV